MRYGPTIAFAVLASVGAAGWYWLNNSSADQVTAPAAHRDVLRKAMALCR